MVDFQPPTTSQFSYSDNDSGATTAINYDANRGYSFARTDTGPSGDVAAFQGKAVPTGGSWSAKMKFTTGPQNASASEYHRYGFAIHSSATHKSIWAGINLQSGQPNLCVIDDKFTGTIFSDTIAGRIPQWFRIDYDGTHYTFYVSLDDNITWVQLGQITAASYFTADYIGAYIETFNGISIKPTMNILYYGEP